MIPSARLMVHHACALSRSQTRARTALNATAPYTAICVRAVMLPNTSDCATSDPYSTRRNCGNTASMNT